MQIAGKNERGNGSGTPPEVQRGSGKLMPFGKKSAHFKGFTRPKAPTAGSTKRCREVLEQGKEAQLV